MGGWVAIKLLLLIFLKVKVNNTIIAKNDYKNIHLRNIYNWKWIILQLFSNIFSVLKKIYYYYYILKQNVQIS